MINVFETAASKISELLVEEQKAGGGLRVFALIVFWVVLRFSG